MVRWQVRLLTLLTVVLLAGFPVLAAVCDATCASMGQAASNGAATPAHHLHDHAAAGAQAAVEAQAHHHHHDGTEPTPVRVEASGVEAIPSNDCSTEARLSAWVAEPRTELGSRATLLPLTSAGVLPHSPQTPPGPFATAPAQSSRPAIPSRASLVLRI